MRHNFAIQIPAWMELYEVPAASLAIIEHGKLAYSGGFGMLNDTLMKADTVFSAQSLTKPLFAFVVLKMIAQGQLSLDTPLSAYIDTPYVTGDERIALITARHVLSHATGLPNWREPDEAVTLKFMPATDFNYSGDGFCYLQTAIEHITGERLEDLMVKALTQFGMHDSYMATFTDEQREHWFYKNFANLNTNAAFSLMTSADDYAKFLLAMLDKAYQSITGMMLVPHQGVAAKPNLHWGLGWGIEDTSKGRYFWQWGAGQDERHLAIGNIEEQWVAVIMTHGNDGQNNGLRLANKIIQHYDTGLGTWLQWQDG